jgi:hypothetical protein
MFKLLEMNHNWPWLLDHVVSEHQTIEEAVEAMDRNMETGHCRHPRISKPDGSLLMPYQAHELVA